MPKIFYAQNKQHTIKYKYVFKVTRNTQEAIIFFRERKKPLERHYRQINGPEQVFYTPDIMNGATNDTDYHTSILVHMWFGLKCNPRRKLRLFAVVNNTGYIDKDAYCGVFNIWTIMTVFFLWHINNLYVTATNVGNYHLHGFNNDQIYMLEGKISMD